MELKLVRQSIAHLFTCAYKLDTPHRISPSVSGGTVKRFSGFKSQPAHAIYWQVFVLRQSMLTHFLSHPFQFMIHLPSYNSMHIVPVSDRRAQLTARSVPLCSSRFKQQSLPGSSVLTRPPSISITRFLDSVNKSSFNPFCCLTDPHCFMQQARYSVFFHISFFCLDALPGEIREGGL